MLRRTTVLAGALALLLVLAASAQAATVRKDFLTFNACGAIWDTSEPDPDDDCPNWGDRDQPGDDDADSVVAAIDRSITNAFTWPNGASARPDAVMLQEICFTQYVSLKNRIADVWPMDGEFRAHSQSIDGDTRDEARCEGTDKRHGIAVLVRGTIDHDVSDTLEFTNQVGNDERKLLCVKVDWKNPTRVCSTHLTNQDDFPCSTDGHIKCQDKQAEEIEAWVREKYIKPYDTPVVIGGDFNSEPTQRPLHHLYHEWVGQNGASPPSHGQFREVDQGQPDCRCGEGTWKQTSDKIDYIFVSRNKWTNVGGAATTSAFSDHDPLRGHAELEYNAG